MINYMLTQISAYSIMNEFHCSRTAKEDREYAHACEREWKREREGERERERDRVFSDFINSIE